jgi:hypothetical protein
VPPPRYLYIKIVEIKARRQMPGISTAVRVSTAVQADSTAIRMAGADRGPG